MPIYTYNCESCNSVIERRQSFSDDPLTTCEQCGGPLHKVIHPVGIVFKGSGWYVTDSRNASKQSANGVNKTESSSSETAKSDGSKSDTGSTSATAPAPAASSAS